MRPAVLVAALLMALHAATFWGAGPFDDDFICYRYARNLVEGQGLVFQAGEAIEGFTNPLWVLLMAGALALDLEPTLVSRVIGLLAAAVAAWAVGDAWARRYPEDRLSPALLVALLPPMAWHAVTGLGTTLLAALLALAFRAWDRSEDGGGLRMTGVFLALACLLRQEAALFALPFAGWAWRREGGRVAALLPLISLVAWSAFRWHTYGRLLPMPWYAKKLPLLADWGYGLRYLYASTLTAGIGVLALLAPAARRPWRAAGYGVLLHTLYVVHVGGDFMALARFHVPVLPVAVVLAASAVRERAPRPALALGVVFGLCVQWVQWPWSDGAAQRHDLVLEQARRFRFLDHEVFEQRWASIGRGLEQACAPGTLVATSPIGAIGYYSRLPLVDILGLTNSSSLGVEPDLEGVEVKGHHRFDAQWVLDQRPALIVLGNGVHDGAGRVSINPWERGIVTHPDFARDYVPFVLPLPALPDDEALRLWRRRDLPVPAGAR